MDFSDFSLDEITPSSFTNEYHLSCVFFFGQKHEERSNLALGNFEVVMTLIHHYFQVSGHKRNKINWGVLLAFKLGSS